VIVGIENVGGDDSLKSNQKRVYDLTPPGLSVSGSDENQGEIFFSTSSKKNCFRQWTGIIGLPHLECSSAYRLGLCWQRMPLRLDQLTQRLFHSMRRFIWVRTGWLRKLIARTSTSGRPVRYASLEAKFGWPDNEWQKLASTAPASWRIYREKFQLEGHETLQMIGAYIGLRQVFGDYSRFSAPEFPTTSILPYYSKVNESLGGNVYSSEAPA
jgi:hypothetical protein